MTKHNGKARKSGFKVGQALIAAQKKGGGGAGVIAGRHTTDIKPGGTNMQSVLERNDLAELMAMAELSGRDFTAEKSHVIVVSTGAVDPLDEQRAAEERAATEERNRHRLRIPRRPAWDESTTPEQLDTQERTSFVAWRRELAVLEEEEGLVLTPFEKNLEVWRQLWRVLERSDIVVQVVDARDPLLYRCEDLEAYARELHASKASLLLLNKADLLPDAARARWADYLDKVGMPYVFWSAARVMDEHAALKAEAQELGLDWHELREARQRERRLARVAAEAQLLANQGQAAVDAARRTHILDDDELIQLLEEQAAQAVRAAGPEDPRAQDTERRLMVGLIGYPNVGKSSTINALFGAKKTAVAPTPGKTKHFQTLIVSPTLCLCDCPGLVMPKFARSKAEMVAAGVIPIDRLTEMRGPVEVLAQRVGRGQVEELYGLRLPPAPTHQAPTTPPTAAQLLHTLAALRGWTVGSGLPDESRAGRQLLKDYCAGKLLHCMLPPGSQPPCFVPLLHDPHTLQPLPQGPRSSAAPHSSQHPSEGLQGQAGPRPAAQSPQQQPLPAGTSQQPLTSPGDASPSGSGVPEGPGAPGGGASALPQAFAHLDLDAADLDLLASELGEPAAAAAAAAGEGGARGSKPRRAEHKFQKKLPRGKGDRGQARDAGGYDGAGITVGKKGGLVRIAGY